MKRADAKAGYQFEWNIRVRYAETDRMGYVYYGNFATYFEVARVEALRQLGISYKQLEDDGVMLPVLDYKVKYYRPAYYDDNLRIVVRIVEMPGTRIHFAYDTFNEKEILINQSETTLVFVHTDSGKPCRPPQAVLNAFRPYFTSE